MEYKNLGGKIRENVFSMFSGRNGPILFVATYCVKNVC